MTNIYRPETKVKIDQLVTTGTPSSSSFLAGDGSYQEITIDPFDVVGGRLDLVSATSIKWGFQNSNQIRLYNGTDWELVKVATEPTIANTALDLNGTALAVDKIYDVFAEYSSSTAFTLVASRWQAATAGTSSRTAAWGGSTAYKIGDRVSNSSHYYCCIDDHTSHATTFSNDSAYWQDNGVATDVGSSDFYGLYRHDGVLVSDSSTTGKSRRWLGIIYTYNNSGTVNFKDDVNYRFVSNFYNKVLVTCSPFMSTTSWTYNTSAWRECYAGSGIIRGNYILADTYNNTIASFTAYVEAASASGYIAIGLNSTTASTVSMIFASNDIRSKTQILSSVIGLNYITYTEYVGSGTVTFYGTTNIPSLVKLYR